MSKINLTDSDILKDITKNFEFLNVIARIKEIEKKLAILEPKAEENQIRSVKSLEDSTRAINNSLESLSKSQQALQDSNNALSNAVDSYNLTLSGFQSSFLKIRDNFKTFTDAMTDYRNSLITNGVSAKNQASLIASDVNQAVSAIQTFNNEVSVLSNWQIINFLGIPIIHNMGGWLQQLQKTLQKAKTVMDETDDVLARLKTYVNWMGDVQKSQSDQFKPIDEASNDLYTSFASFYSQVANKTLRDV